MNSILDNTSKNTLPTRVIRLKEVLHLTSISESTIRRKIKKSTFPLPIKISDRAIGWYENEIQNYIQSLPRASMEEITELLPEVDTDLSA